jgi:hypothetical protein
MFADLRRLIEFADSIEISDPRALESYFRSPPHNLMGDELANTVAEQITAETARANAVLHDRFNNMLELLQRHTLNAHTRSFFPIQSTRTLLLP